MIDINTGEDITIETVHIVILIGITIIIPILTDIITTVPIHTGITTTDPTPIITMITSITEGEVFE